MNDYDYLTPFYSALESLPSHLLPFAFKALLDTMSSSGFSFVPEDTYSFSYRSTYFYRGGRSNAYWYARRTFDGVSVTRYVGKSLSLSVCDDAVIYIHHELNSPPPPFGLPLVVSQVAI